MDSVYVQRRAHRTREGLQPQPYSFMQAKTYGNLGTKNVRLYKTIVPSYSLILCSRHSSTLIKNHFVCTTIAWCGRDMNNLGIKYII
jgi:hypothetical protein